MRETKLFYKKSQAIAVQRNENSKGHCEEKGTSTNQDDAIQLMIYYQTKKTSQFLIKNKEVPRSKTQEDHVIYKLNATMKVADLNHTSG